MLDVRSVSGTVTLLLLVLGLAFSSIASANTYYISASQGNDANDGRSPQTPWRTLQKASHAGLPVGADVLLRSGDVFENQSLWVSWHGTPADWVKIGCYVPNGAGARDCGDADLKAEINGTLEESCAANCPFMTYNAVPADVYAGLVHITTNYVHVERLALKDSAGAPIAIASTNTHPLHHHTLEDLYIRRSANTVILFGRGAQYGTVRRVDGSHYNLCEVYAFEACDYPGWPPGIMVTDSRPAYMLWEDNYVHEGFGEGFNCLRSTHVVMRGNRTGDVHSDGYYMDNCSNVIVENNIAFGNPSNSWGANWAFAGVNVGHEFYGTAFTFEATNNIIRNNLIAGYGTCIAAGSWTESMNLGVKIGFHAYGNTCVGTHRQYVSLWQANVDEIVIQNNIFYTHPGNLWEGPCRLDVSHNVTFGKNLWQSTAGNLCARPDDLVGDPMLVGTVEEYKAMNASDQATPQDFALRPGSPVYRAGTGFVDVPEGLTTQYAFANTEPEGGCDLNTAPLDVDFHCSKRQNPPSIGAIDKINYPPKPPTILQ